MTHFESLWTGMTHHNKFMDRYCTLLQQKYSSKNIVMPPQKIIIRVLTHRKIIYHGAWKSFYYSKYEIQKYIFMFLLVTFGEGSGLPSLLIFRGILRLWR
jgi:hypothetical protein